MAYYVIEVLHSQPGSPVCAGERLGEFESRDEALRFIEIAAGTRWAQGCELVVRREGIGPAPERTAA